MYQFAPLEHIWVVSAFDVLVASMSEWHEIKLSTQQSIKDFAKSKDRFPGIVQDVIGVLNQKYENSEREEQVGNVVPLKSSVYNQRLATVQELRSAFISTPSLNDISQEQLLLALRMFRGNLHTLNASALSDPLCFKDVQHKIKTLVTAVMCLSAIESEDPGYPFDF